jgi:hypothetical protein
MRNLNEIKLHNNDHLGTICSIGLLLGVIHVLTGADHLAAISLITTNKNMKESFIAGTIWGLGHCIGLSIIAAIFFGLNNKYSFLEKNTTVADKIVGFFMITLGCYGFYNSRKIYLEMDISTTNTIVVQNDEISCIEDIEKHEDKRNYNDGLNTHRHCCGSHINDTKCYSIFIGIIHGISGTGAILGILPAASLHNSSKTTVYLVSFFTSSVLSMGIYAVSWSKINSYIKDIGKTKLYHFYMQFIMSTLTIGIGILWLVISFTVGLDYYGL